MILHATKPPDERGWTQLFSETCIAAARADHPIFAKPDVSPGDVLDCKLVHIAHGKGPEPGEFTWRTWAERLGLAQRVPSTMLTVSAEHLAVDLVLAEDVLTLVSLQTAGRLLREGRLRAVPGSAVVTGRSYWARLGNADTAAPKLLFWLQAGLAS